MKFMFDSLLFFLSTTPNWWNQFNNPFLTQSPNFVWSSGAPWPPPQAQFFFLRTCPNPPLTQPSFVFPKQYLFQRVPDQSDSWGGVNFCNCHWFVPITIVDRVGRRETILHWYCILFVSSMANLIIKTNAVLGNRWYVASWL